MSYYSSPLGPPPGAQNPGYPGQPFQGGPPGQGPPGHPAGPSFSPPPQQGSPHPPQQFGAPAGSPPVAQRHMSQHGGPPFQGGPGSPSPSGFSPQAGPSPGGFAPPQGPGGPQGPPQGHPQGPPQSHPQGPPQGPPPSAGPPQQQFHAAGPTIQDTIGSFEGVQYRIDHRDSNSLLSMNLQPGYEVKGRPGSMVAMAGSVQIKGKVKISLTKMITGGQMTESTFTGPGEVLLAPEVWGDIVPVRLDGQTTWNLGKDAFLACTHGVTRSTKAQGLGKALFSGEGLFVAKATGVGILFIQSLGAIVQKQLAPGEHWIVDNGHLVAWTASYSIERIGGGGFISNAATAEGLVCRFTGPGIIYIQTRNPESLGLWIASQMPGGGKGGGGGGVIGALLS